MVIDYIGILWGLLISKLKGIVARGAGTSGFQRVMNNREYALNAKALTGTNHERSQPESNKNLNGEYILALVRRAGFEPALLNWEGEWVACLTPPPPYAIICGASYK